MKDKFINQYLKSKFKTISKMKDKFIKKYLK